MRTPTWLANWRQRPPAPRSLSGNVGLRLSRSNITRITSRRSLAVREPLNPRRFAVHALSTVANSAMGTWQGIKAAHRGSPLRVRPRSRHGPGPLGAHRDRSDILMLYAQSNVERPGGPGRGSASSCSRSWQVHGTLRFATPSGGRLPCPRSTPVSCPPLPRGPRSGRRSARSCCGGWRRPGSLGRGSPWHLQGSSGCTAACARGSATGEHRRHAARQPARDCMRPV